MNPLLALLPAVAAQSMDGFLEVRATGMAGVDGAPVQVVERLRPEFSAPLGDRLSLTSTVELSLTQGRDTQTELQRTLEDSDLGPLLDLAGCTWPEDENERLDVSTLSDWLAVERLYLDAYTPYVDLRLGRQAVNWGSAFLVNPTDPFPEVLLTEPWKPRAGVNALRATVPVAPRHQVQGLLGTDDTFSHVRLAGRATANLWETDFSLVGAWRQENEELIVGGDVRGTLGVGFWLEGVAHVDLERDGAYDPTPDEEIAVGADYSFPVREALVITAQYYRNGLGSPDAEPSAGASSLGSTLEPPTCAMDTGDLFGSEGASTNDFAPLFHGRDYAMASVMLSWSPEVSATALGILNLGDGTGLVMPVVTTAPLDWLEVSAAAQVPFSAWGDGGELHPSADDLVVEVDTGAPSPLALDLSGLVPAATFILWTRLDF